MNSITTSKTSSFSGSQPSPFLYGGTTIPIRPAPLILNSTFASMPETVAWHYPYFPFRYLLLDRWPSIERIPNVDVPVMIFHGADDRMVPVAHAKKLADASPRARFIEIPGAGHNNIPMFQLREKLGAISDNLPAKTENGNQNG